MKEEPPTLKRDKKMQKQSQKGKEALSRILSKILQSNFVEASCDLEDIIMGDYSHDFSPFLGIGNIQNWLYNHPGDPERWLRTLDEKNQLGQNPFDLFNVCQMIILHKQQKKAGEILEMYEKLLKKDNLRLELLLGKGNIDYQRKQYNKAIATYLKIDEESDRVDEYLSWAYHKLEDLSKMLQYASKALLKNPNNMCCQLLQILGKQQSIVENLQSLLEKYPEYYMINLLIGNYQLERQKAQRNLDICLQKQPESAFFMAKKAQKLYGYERQKDQQTVLTQQAFDLMEKALQVQPECTQAIILKINFFTNGNDIIPFQEVQTFMDNLSLQIQNKEIQLKQPRFIASIIEYWVKNNKHSQARQLIDILKKISPRYSRTLALQAELMRDQFYSPSQQSAELQRPQSAQQAQQAVQQSQSSSYSQQSQQQQEQNDSEYIIKKYEQAHKANPKDELTILQFAKYIMKYEEKVIYPKAEELYKEGMALNKKNPGFIVGLFDCYLQQEKYQAILDEIPNGRQSDMLNSESKSELHRIQGKAFERKKDCPFSCAFRCYIRSHIELDHGTSFSASFDNTQQAILRKSVEQIVNQLSEEEKQNKTFMTIVYKQCLKYKLEKEMTIMVQIMPSLSSIGAQPGNPKEKPS